jgi:tetratricopeptide (TPR) repeat protein
MRLPRALLAALALTHPALLPAAAPPAKGDPPYRWSLRGEAAERVARLQKEVDRLVGAEKFVEAARQARLAAEVRTRAQGGRHWQVIDARWRARTLTLLAVRDEKERTAFFGLSRLNVQAERLDRQGRSAQARALYEKVLATRRKVLGEDHPQTARSYNNLAMNLDDRGKYRQAQPLYEKALAVCLKALGEDHPATAHTCTNLASNLDEQGKHRQAQPLHQKALAIRLRVLGKRHRHTATSYGHLAQNLLGQGKPEQAQPLYEKALAIHLALLGPHHPDTAGSYNGVACALRARGKHRQAQPLFEKVLGVYRKALGEGHPSTADAYNNLATDLDELGMYARAEPLYHRALVIQRKVLGEEHPLTALSYNNLATNLGSQGKYAQAQPLYEKALAIRKKVLGEDHRDTALSYNNAASNLGAQRKDEQAQVLYEMALRISRKVLGEEHPQTALGYNNVAMNLDELGKHARALPLHQKALALYRKVLGEHHPDTARGYNNVAFNLEAQGKPVQAQPLYEKALAIYRDTLGPEHPSTTLAFANLARNQHAQGKYAAAEKSAQQAARAFEAARLQVNFTGLDRAAFTSRESPLPLLAALRARLGRSASAWEALEAGLARGLLDDLAARRRTLSAAQRRRFDDLLGQLRLLNRQLPALLAARGDAARRHAERLRRRRAAAQQAFNELQAELAREHGPGGGQVYDRAHVQKHLAREDALLAWIDGRGEHWACLLRQKGAPIWVRLPGSGAEGAWTDADKGLPRQLRARLRRAARDAGAWRDVARKLYAQRLAPLSKHLGATRDLPAVRRLIVLPSPAVAGIPVEVLLAAGPREAPACTVSYAPSATLFAYLQEQRARSKPQRNPRLLALGDPAFRRADTPTQVPDPPRHGVLLTRVQRGSAAERAGLKAGDVLLRYAGSKVKDVAALVAALKKYAGEKPGKEPSLEVAYWRAGKTVTTRVFPGPLHIAIDRRSPAQALRVAREAEAVLARTRDAVFRALPGTRREVEALARFFDKAETLLGADASEQQLGERAGKGELKAYRYLHFATHGLADAVRPLRSFLALADRDLPDPLTRVLAGKPAYTGRLSAGHILANWRLDAELVVLSACQSGLGKYERGEGYVGFAQALFLAGARSLVLSQWSVDDEATALLMVRFYQNLLGKREGLKKPMEKAEALREAKAWLRGLSAKEVKVAVASLPRGKVVPRKPAPKGGRPYAHPYYWAGFILIGDPH